MTELIKIESEIKQCLENMFQFGRRTVEEAVRIGELLKEAKGELAHGDFTPWCERLGIKHDNARRYMALDDYKPEMRNMRNLAEAYTLIESEENKRKQEEFRAQSKRIDQFKKTGTKPEGWDENTDAYRLKKEKEDEAFRERKEKAFAEKREEFKLHKTINKPEIDNLLERSRRYQEERAALFGKMRLTGNNAHEPIFDALMEYLLTKTDSARLEACHNIIKFCKGLAAELQRQSVEVKA